MGKQTHYGKPSSYPYYFKAGKGFNSFTSGTFKTKKAAKEAAQDYGKRTGLPHRVIDRRSKRR